ncbi:hypothetical protein ACIXEF_04330 [Bacteroides fragilis]
MEKNIFKLDNEQLKGIAHAFREKVEEGLNKKVLIYISTLENHRKAGVGKSSNQSFLFI